MLNKKLVPIFIILLSLSACAGQQNNKTADSQTAGQTAASTATEKSATSTLCDIITAADISKIVGTEFKADPNLLPTQTATTKGCDYKDASGFGLNIISNYDNESQAAADAYDDVYQLQQGSAGYQELNGIGQKAFSWSNKFMLQLNAYNKNVWITMTVNLENVDKLDIAKKVATMAFSKL
jgi:hypothetical protein